MLRSSHQCFFSVSCYFMTFAISGIELRVVLFVTYCWDLFVCNCVTTQMFNQISEEFLRIHAIMAPLFVCHLSISHSCCRPLQRPEVGNRYGHMFYTTTALSGESSGKGKGPQTEVEMRGGYLLRLSSFIQSTAMNKYLL